MRILVPHNRYIVPGGEDSVVNSEVELLKSKGHAVLEYRRDNSEVERLGKLRLGLQTMWSRDSHKEALRLTRAFSPDVVHVHNTFPLISPSIYWACAEAGIPVVQTLHNFRLLCPQAMLLRDGKVCEDCLGHVPWRGVVHRCYRNSLAQSFVSAATVTLHRSVGTWQSKIARYIALNRFCRDKFVEGGLPADRIRIKPNFIDLPDAPEPTTDRQGFLYVGRLSVEKGIQVLLDAVDATPIAHLRVAGHGNWPGLGSRERVTALGSLEQSQVIEEMRRATALVLPSIWYENFPRTLAEAFANGLPIIASRIGALTELVKDGITGLLFEPADSQGLARCLHYAAKNPEHMQRMGLAARRKFASEFGAERNYKILMQIYAEAIEHSIAAPESLDSTLNHSREY